MKMLRRGFTRGGSICGNAGKFDVVVCWLVESIAEEKLSHHDIVPDAGPIDGAIGSVQQGELD